MVILSMSGCTLNLYCIMGYNIVHYVVKQIIPKNSDNTTRWLTPHDSALYSD